jgi:hypothetical protein
MSNRNRMQAQGSVTDQLMTLGLDLARSAPAVALWIGDLVAGGRGPVPEAVSVRLAAQRANELGLYDAADVIRRRLPDAER